MLVFEKFYVVFEGEHLARGKGVDVFALRHIAAKVVLVFSPAPGLQTHEGAPLFARGPDAPNLGLGRGDAEVGTLVFVGQSHLGDGGVLDDEGVVVESV